MGQWESEKKKKIIGGFQILIFQGTVIVDYNELKKVCAEKKKKKKKKKNYHF